MPNFFVPMVQQGQQGPRPGGRRAGAVQQTQQPVPMMQQQVDDFSFHLSSSVVGFSCYLNRLFWLVQWMIDVA